MTAQKLWIGDVTAGDWNNDTAGTTQNPATGLGGVSLSTVGTTLFPWACFTATSDSVTMNFGDSAFSGVVPSGFAAGWPGTAAAVAQSRVMVMA